MELRIEKIGNATLYLGDCREILPTLPKVDLVLTDPPYGIGADTNQFKNGTSKRSELYGDTNWDSETPDRWVLEMACSKGTNAILWGGNYYLISAQKCWLVWDKDTGNNSYADAELAWTNLDGAVRLIKHQWLGANAKDSDGRLHPTQKPIRVMEWCIGLSKDALTVADPFMGSGTTGVACANMGKTFYGIEREPKYFDIACRRIEQAYAQQRLFA
jgi:site-specific DNA-methyltransferase (adenine-specific)/modification methylase